LLLVLDLNLQSLFTDEQEIEQYKAGGRETMNGKNVNSAFWSPVNRVKG
jgi:hypothetical protein